MINDVKDRLDYDRRERRTLLVLRIWAGLMAAALVAGLVLT